MRRKGPVSLWLQYFPTYTKIRSNPALRSYMRSNPGFRWMNRGPLVVWFIICVLIIIAKLFK